MLQRLVGRGTWSILLSILLNEDNQQVNTTLKGLRILDLTHMLSGPYAGMMLADLGAEIIKIENPESGDPFRGWGAADYSATFGSVNRNKKSVALDLKSEAGYEVLRKLVAGADVLVTNYRIKALQRLKLEYENIRAINPRIIYALATGFGERGEERHKPGYDTVCYWSRSAIETQVFPYEGWLSAFPYGAGDHPEPPVQVIADKACDNRQHDGLSGRTGLPGQRGQPGLHHRSQGQHVTGQQHQDHLHPELEQR